LKRIYSLPADSKCRSIVIVKLPSSLAVISKVGKPEIRTSAGQ
jgi:hypothetical protein